MPIMNYMGSEWGIPPSASSGPSDLPRVPGEIERRGDVEVVVVVDLLLLGVVNEKDLVVLAPLPLVSLNSKGLLPLNQ